MKLMCGIRLRLNQRYSMNRGKKHSERSQTSHLLDKRFRRLLPLSVPFLAVTLLESPLLLALALVLLDFTGLRPRVLVVRFFSLSLRGAGERERLLRPLKTDKIHGKISKQTI